MPTLFGLTIFGLVAFNSNEVLGKELATKEVSHVKEKTKKSIYKVSGISFTKPKKLKTGKVISAQDGDTIKVLIKGKEETIQLMTIDTPEITDKNGKQQFQSIEAAQFAKETLEGKSVKLDIGKKRNKQKQLEAQVWIGDTLFNALTVSKGFARTDKKSINKKLISPLQKLEEVTKKSKIGIWSIDGYVTKDGYNMLVFDKEEEKPGVVKNWKTLTMDKWIDLKAEEKLYVVEMSINLETSDQKSKNTPVEVRGTLEEFVKVINDRYTEINSSKDPYEKLRMMGSPVSAQVSIMGHQENLIEFVYNQ